MGINQSVNLYPNGVISFGTNEMARDSQLRKLLELPDNPGSDRYVRVDPTILDDQRVQKLVDFVFDRVGGDFFIAIDRRNEYCGPEIVPQEIRRFAASDPL